MFWRAAGHRQDLAVKIFVLRVRRILEAPIICVRVMGETRRLTHNEELSDRGDHYQTHQQKQRRRRRPLSALWTKMSDEEKLVLSAAKARS
jgi:hypothetical protein